MEKILIVDDNEKNLYMLQTLLTAKGHEAVTASNGQDALEKLGSESFGMIISDILMPVMDGFQLCRHCKGDEALQGIPFVFYTATYVDEKDEAFAYEIGVDRFIRKPVEPHVFIKIIEEVIEGFTQGKVEPRKPVKRADEEAYKLYSERLVRKLEKKMEDLEISEARYASLINDALDTSRVGLFILDADFKIVWINQAMERYFGLQRDQVIGKDKRLLIRERINTIFEDSEGFSERVLSAYANNTYIENFECHVLPGERRGEYWLQHWSQPIQSGLYAGGRIEHYYDISKRKRAEEEKEGLQAKLRQAQKMEAIGTLAGGIAHDFNNILSAIIGFTQLAMDQLPKESPVHADLKEVYRGGERARDLVRQILAFSRQREEAVAPTQIAPILKEALKLLRATLPASIEIRQDIAPQVGNIMADPTQVHQIIMNICTNASHAMREEGGILEVSLTKMRVDHDFARQRPGLRPGEFVRLSISDTGSGIAPEILNKIFDPYFTTKEKGQGTGLGLAVVHGIVKGCGGAITVSTEPGKGSDFHVYLPSIQKEVKPDEDKPESIPGGDERILFVDDERPLAELGEKLLTKLGYRVEARTSPVEALELFRAKPDRFDLVITDMTMPHMTGDRLAQELMKIRPDIPVILCTGFSEKMRKEKAEDLGIKGIIMKPLIRDELARAVRKAIEED